MAVNDDDVAPAGGLDALMPRFQGAYQDIYKKMQENAAAKQAAQQSYLSMLQQQEGPLSQTGISDLDKAAMFAQAAGAFGAPTRSGGFTETLANVGTTLAGPLSKQAEIQRARSQQLQQLQLARQKLGMEMAGSGGVDPAQAMQLLKAQQDQEEEKRTPNADEIIASQLKPEDRPAFWRTKAGLEKSAEKKEKVSDKTLSDFTESGATLTEIDDLKTRFKPEYAGKMLDVVGEAQNTAGSRGYGYQDQAQWWKDYNARKNVARNALFGSAVTVGEKKAFDKADISPGMSADLIETNLAKQREIARSAVYKLAKAKELQGTDLAPIEAAIGYSMKDLEKSSQARESAIRSSPKGSPDAQGWVTLPNGIKIRQKQD